MDGEWVWVCISFLEVSSFITDSYLVFAGFANMMLQKAFNYTQEKTYSGIAKSIWNGKFEIFVDLIQFLYSVGTCCGYAIIIANELYLCVSFITEGKVVPSSLEFLTRSDSISC